MQSDGIAVVATDALAFFTTATRNDGVEFVKLAEDAPEWVSDMVFACHDGGLPNDWTYEVVRNAVEWLSEGNDPSDSGDFCDDQVDVYTSNLLAWLAGGPRRCDSCDLASDDYGAPEPDTMVNRIMRGQFYEASEIFSQVVYELNEQATDEADRA